MFKEDLPGSSSLITPWLVDSAGRFQKEKAKYKISTSEAVYLWKEEKFLCCYKYSEEGLRGCGRGGEKVQAG